MKTKDRPRNNHNDFFYAFLMLCLFIYILLCMVSCSAPRCVASSQKDSIRTVITDRIVYRDTVIMVPVPTESNNVVQEHTDTSLLRTSLAESEAFVSGGELHHTLRNRSELVQPINLKMPVHLVNTDSFQLAARTITVEVEKDLTRWQKLFLALGQGTFVTALGIIIYLLVRIIRKLT